MDKKLWQDVESLFHEALELEPRERRAFVKQHAGANSQLEMEVITLLSSHDSNSDFLDHSMTPDWSDALDQLASDMDSSSLTPAVSLSGGTEKNAEQKTLDLNPTSATKTFERTVASLIESVRDDFIVKKTISRGGMGTVLRVYQRKLDRDVAVKVLSATEIDDVMRRRFVRESKAAAQVIDDHVIGIHEVCDDHELPFLVMELIDGPSLKRYIEMNHSLSPEIAAKLARQIATGLVAAHHQNLLHRDIKPANVLLEPHLSENGEDAKCGLSYRAKIIDFGLAREIDNPTGETEDQLFAGTLSYMSPEQLSRPEKIDHRSDIYSLGVTLYQMLTGEQPFRGAPHIVMRRIEIADPTQPGKLDDRIPKDLESICMMAMAKDPQRRYQTAKHFADDLTRFLNGKPTVARPVSQLEKMGRWVKRNKSVSLFAGLAATLLMMLTISSLVFAYTVRNKDSQINEQSLAITDLDQTIDKQQEITLDSQIKRILDADPSALKYAIQDLNPKSKTAVESLEIEFKRDSNGFNRRFNAAVALAALGVNETQYIIENLDSVFVSNSVFRNALSAIKNDSDAIQDLLDSLKTLDEYHPEYQVKMAKRIILLAHLNQFQPWIDALDNRQNLSVNTEVIHTFPNWHGDPVELSEAIAKVDNEDLQWAFCHAIQILDQRSLNQEQVETLTEHFRLLAANTTHPASYASAVQLLKKWEANVSLRKESPNNRWYELENGMRLIRVEPCTSRLGRLDPMKLHLGFPAHDVTITRPFFLADTEVTVAQYLEFTQDPECSIEFKPYDLSLWKYSEAISPTTDHPIQKVSWNDAAMFCNWLSRKEGLRPFYKRMPELKSGDDPTQREYVAFVLNNKEEVQFQHWECDYQSNGYRLPLEHEFGLACRVGSETRYYYGDQAEYFAAYGLATNHTRLPASPVRTRLPNRLGIFDLHGNVWEWCNDWFYHLDPKPMTDPIGPDEPDLNYKRYGRVVRSGGVGTMSGDTDSDARGADRPEVRWENLGFRVARYADGDD